MRLIDTAIPDVKIIEPRIFGDPRGFFMETWIEQAFAALGLDLHFVQDNHSRSRQGILRGLHYQVQHPQGKLVRVTQGKVFDVAVDIRRNSPSFGQWVGVELSEDNPQMLWVPPGFAHGFYVMSESVDFLYKCTDIYAPEHERSLQWDDPTLAINWPLVNDDAPLLSAKDTQAASWQDAEMFE
jgi:dTDP-4-dehydrorhamnose 3,5-epimerase